MGLILQKLISLSCRHFISFPFSFDDSVCKSFWVFGKKCSFWSKQDCFLQLQMVYVQNSALPKSSLDLTASAGELCNGCSQSIRELLWNLPWSWLWPPQRFQKHSWQWIFNSAVDNMLIEIKISWTCKKSDFLRQLPLKCLVGIRAISGDFPSLAACKAGVYEAYFQFSALQTAHRWLRGSETFSPPALVPGHIQVGQCHWVTPEMGPWSCQHLCWDPALLRPPVKTLPGLCRVIPLSYQLPYL